MRTVRFAKHVKEFRTLNEQDQEKVKQIKFSETKLCHLAFEEKHANDDGNANMYIIPARPCVARTIHTSDWSTGGGQVGQHAEGSKVERLGHPPCVLFFDVPKTTSTI